jgi:hypothetical protein
MHIFKTVDPIGLAVVFSNCIKHVLSPTFVAFLNVCISTLKCFFTQSCTLFFNRCSFFVFFCFFLSFSFSSFYLVSVPVLFPYLLLQTCISRLLFPFFTLISFIGVFLHFLTSSKNPFYSGLLNFTLCLLGADRVRFV